MTRNFLAANNYHCFGFFFLPISYFWAAAKYLWLTPDSVLRDIPSCAQGTLWDVGVRSQILCIQGSTLTAVPLL